MAKLEMKRRPWANQSRATKKPWDQSVGKYRDKDRYDRDEKGGSVFATKWVEGAVYRGKVAVVRIVVPASGELGSGSTAV